MCTDGTDCAAKHEAHAGRAHNAEDGQNKVSRNASLPSLTEVIHADLPLQTELEALPIMDARLTRIRETVLRRAEASIANMAQGDAGPGRAICILQTLSPLMCHR